MTTQTYRICRSIVVALCSVGISASIYAYYVETRKETDADYKAACDISESVSCSKVFTSRFGRGFGLLEYLVGRDHWLNQPNSVFGIAFYVLQILLGQIRRRDTASIQVMMSTVANIGSVYLASILYFVLHDFCVVCFLTYVINFLILLCNIKSRRLLDSSLGQMSKSKHSARSKQS